MDRVAAALRSRVMRLRPLRMLAAAGAVAVVAVALFAALALGSGPGIARSGAAVPPQWAGSVSTLSHLGVYDTDSDGLADALENLVYGTDPARMDSSASGIPDGWLVRFGFDPLDPAIGSTPAASPSPSDLPTAYKGTWPPRFVPTLLDVYRHGRPAEWNESTQGPFDSGLDPRRWDSGQEGLPDGWLMHHGLDPLANGTASMRPAGAQGLTVLEAFRHGTDPTKPDSDGDGLQDRAEIDGPVNPRGPPARFKPTDPARLDTSGTGICDGYLVAFGLDPHQAAALRGDADRDGATTKEEHDWSRERHGAEACRGKGMDPTRQRSGSSAIPDGWLLRHGLDPFSAGIDNRTTQSSLQDPQPSSPASGQPPLNLTVRREYEVNRPADWDEAASGPWWGGSDPAANDTDGDGLGDAWELRGLTLQASTDPLRPLPVPYTTTSDPTKKDSDGDGLEDGEEVDPARRTPPGGGRTDPRRWDTDFDGIDDGTEAGLGLGLDPARADSAEDLLGDGRRLGILASRADAYLASRVYEHPGEPGVARDVTDWVALARGARDLPKPLTGAALHALVGPRGDLDGDGVPNVADKDIDNDTLLNGWEAEPARYALSPFGAGEFRAGRPGSDPLNQDTDGDSLRDDWEVRNGRPDYRIADRYNLDPSRWDSDAEVEPPGQMVPDDEEDPDADGVTWVSYEAGVPRTVEERYTNAQEQTFRTDPNRFDTDKDGLADGWKVFWGLTYPARDPQGVPPTAPRPQLGENQSATVIQQGRYVRFVLDDEALLPGEQRGGASHVRDPSDLAATRTVYAVDGTVSFRFLDAQAARTNPYRADTDGDGMPDWWETLHATVLPGLAPGGECANVAGPSATGPDAQADADWDGVVNLQEYARGTDPLCADSDGGGVRDGEEDAFGLDPVLPGDDQTLLVDGSDLDGDGVTDFEEITGIRSIDYRSYLGPTPVRTRYSEPDSDGDGLLDGRNMPTGSEATNGWPASDVRAQRFLDLGITYYRTEAGGYVFIGERDRSTDPRNGDDAGIGVPSGWLAAHNIPICTPNLQGCSPTDPGLLRAYSLGRPAWWAEARHGPWWGGAKPTDDLDLLEATPDLDQDGLRDDDAGAGYEDPLPAANLPNALRPVHGARHGVLLPPGAMPEDPGLPAVASRLLAQAVLNPRVLESTHYSRDPAAQDGTPRGQPCLRLDPGQETIGLVKGTKRTVTGRVTLGCGATAPPLANLTVEARMGQPHQVFGADFSGPDGRFAIDVNVTQAQNVAMPPHALVLRGNTTGVVRWDADPSAVAPGTDGMLTIRTYATPSGAAYASRVPALVAAAEHVPVTVTAGSRLELAAPRAAVTGGDIAVAVRLTDSAGSPLQAQVAVTWLGQPAACPARCVQTGPDGRAEAILPAPHSFAGNRTVVATSDPDGTYVTPTEASTTLLLRRPAALALASPPSTVDAGTTLTLRGRLTVPAEAGGIPVRLNLSAAGQLRAATEATTASDGSFTLRVPIAADAAFGPYVATVAAPATASTQASQAQAVVTVRSVPRFTQVDAAPFAAGAPAVVTARLVEPDGARPVPNAPVTVELDGRTLTGTTDADGRVRVQSAVALPLRPVLERLTFAGDATHLPARASVERAVLSATQLRLDSGLVLRGDEAAIVANLQDAHGRPVAHAPLTLMWGKDAPQVRQTDANGTARFTRGAAIDEPLGDVAVRALYNGSRPSGLAASADQATWSVRAAAEIRLPNGTFELAAAMPPGELRDAATGAPLAGRAVVLRGNGTDGSWVRTATTDDAGRFALLPAAGGNATPRRIEISAHFAGDGVYGRTDNRSAIDQRSPTSLALRVPHAIVAGRPTLVTALVTDLAGRPVPSGEVALVVGDVASGSWPVADGAARLTLRLPAQREPGPTAIEAVYLGDPRHAPSSATATILVLAPVELRIEAPQVRPGETATIRVLALQDGKAMPFTQLSLAVGGLDAGLVATTDRDGIATFHLEQDEASIPLAARYAGDSQFGPAMAHVTLQPGQPAGILARGGPPLAWIATAAAAILVAAAGVAARLRAQPLEDAFRRVHRLFEAQGPTQRAILGAFRILEDAAIGHALLAQPARTPRELEDALRPALPAPVHGSLGAFIGLFEDARYGPAPLDDRHRRAALHGLEKVLVGLGNARGRGQARGGPA